MTDHIISHFAVRLNGEENTPGKVSAIDIAQILVATQELVKAIVEQDDPDIDTAILEIRPTIFQKGSCVIPFSAVRPDLAGPAFAKANDAVGRNNYDSFTEEAREAFRKLIGVARSRNATLQLEPPGETPAVITPATSISVPILIEKTTLYGYINRVGGKQPRVRIQLADDTTVICIVGVEQARIIANHLYTWMGFSGTARWNARTLNLDRFEIEEILSFEQTPLTETFSLLRERFGHYFDAIDDPDDYISKLRSDELED